MSTRALSCKAKGSHPGVHRRLSIVARALAAHSRAGDTTAVYPPLSPSLLPNDQGESYGARWTSLIPYGRQNRHRVSVSTRIRSREKDGCQLRLQHLQRDLPLVLDVGGEVHRRHSTPTVFTLDAVAAFEGGVQAGNGVHQFGTSRYSSSKKFWRLGTPVLHVVGDGGPIPTGPEQLHARLPSNGPEDASQQGSQHRQRRGGIGGRPRHVHISPQA